jgi:elongator complex protein 5
LLLPHTCPILAPLHQPTLSPALTLLYPYHPLVLSHLSRSYLVPVTPSPQLWTILDRARQRHLPEKLAYGGLDGVEVASDWSAPTSSANAGAIVGVLVRKATGGVKGISRALASVTPRSNGTGLAVGPVDELVSVNPINAPGAGLAVVKPATTHVDLDLPFNLSLTDEQKRRRGEVPLPYAHEGEGVGIEFGEDEDDDEED